MIPDPLDGLRLPRVPIEPRRAFAEALWRRLAGGEEAVAQSATVRYFVDDLDEAIEFYRGPLGFELQMHPDPAFAMLTRGDLPSERDIFGSERRDGRVQVRDSQRDTVPPTGLRERAVR